MMITPGQVAELSASIFICPFCECEFDGLSIPRHLWDAHPEKMRKGWKDIPPCGNSLSHEPHDSPPRDHPDDFGWDWCAGMV